MNFDAVLDTHSIRWQISNKICLFPFKFFEIKTRLSNFRLHLIVLFTFKVIKYLRITSNTPDTSTSSNNAFILKIHKLGKSRCHAIVTFKFDGLDICTFYKYKIFVFSWKSTTCVYDFYFKCFAKKANHFRFLSFPYSFVLFFLRR